MNKIPEIVHESWHPYLQPLFDDSKMELIRTRLLPYCKFYPETVDGIFRVFSMPINDIKVVILGQDPYFNGSAIGYAFAVSEKSPYPTSLSIILKEVMKPKTSEEFVDFKVKNPSWKTLSHWVHQGVFLLNTALTVEIGKAGSHLGQWMWFTREVIKAIAQNNPSVWLLWGAKAQGFENYIITEGKTVMTIPSNADKNFMAEITSIESDMNVTLKCPHPAAGSYSGGKTTFEGCNHFELCNEVLNKQGKNIINW